MCGLCACGDGGDSAPASDPPSARTEGGGNSETSTEQPIQNPVEQTDFERLFSNGPLAAQDTSELWGYIDETGAWVISPAFAEARNFWSSGLALVKDAQSQLWGLIDASGSFVVQPTFDNIGNSFGDDMFRVRIPERGWGYIDATGAFVIEPQFDAATDFSEGFARVSSQIQFTGVDNQNYYQLWGYINASGERITEDTFSEAQPFSDGLALVREGDPSGFGAFYGYIDESGSFVIHPMYTRATSFYDGRAFVDTYVMGDPNTYYALIDKEGKYLTGPVSSNLVQPYFRNGVCPVQTLDGTGDVYIDEDGNTVLPKSGAAYADANGFSGELAAVVDAETMLTGYIDTDGNWVIPPQYSSATNFIGGMALVGEAGSLDDILAERTKHWVIDTSGTPLLEFGGDITSRWNWRTPERIAVTEKTSGRTGFWDFSGNIVIEYVYDVAQDFADDYSYAKVQYEGLWGLIDKDGNWLIPAQFLEIAAA